ncbi:MAG: hypothetical protein EOP02_01535 [Proteobacteria bacterium]|nr:MAG: hypothetical protein EOP02_01535 [Pseudomonadota bacterium]
MSLETFRRAARQFLRDIYIVLGSSVVLLVIGFTMAIAHRDAIRSWYLDHFGAPAAEILLGITPWVPS